jgi:hypothetical protein
MPLTICPGCRQNVATDARRCPACGWDVAAQYDRAANRTINLFARGSALAAAAGIVWAKRKYDLELLPAVQPLLVIFLVASLATYVPLKAAMFRSRKKLWLAASGVGALVAAGVFAGRAAIAHGDLPMATLTVSGLTSHRADATQPSTQPAGATAAAKAARPIPPSVTDTYEPLLRAAREALARINQQPDALRAELDAAGVPRLISPATLADARKLAAGRTRIRRLYDRLDAYDAQVRKTVQTATMRVQTADAPPAARARFLASFRPSADDAAQKVSAFIASERQALGQVDALLTFAQAKAGKYTVPGQKVTFQDPQDNAAYATLHHDIAAASGREDQALRTFRNGGETAMRKVITALDNQTAAAE